MTSAFGFTSTTISTTSSPFFFSPLTTRASIAKSDCAHGITGSNSLSREHHTGQVFQVATSKMLNSETNSDPDDADPNEIVARRIIVTGDVAGGYYRSCVKNEVRSLCNAPYYVRDFYCIYCRLFVNLYIKWFSPETKVTKWLLTYDYLTGIVDSGREIPKIVGNHVPAR